ncbi:MAG: DUF952 domain-containing protein [Aeromicrobium sp.]
MPADWSAAVASGEYRVSTRGATLDEVGFIHCSRAEQTDGVRARFYADVPDLLLLTIDTDLLTSPWQFDQVPGQALSFPHVYGPINLDAVVCKDRWHDSEA